ncbi:MAG: hypothetical protein E6I38_12020 [Chloroflexi bacterium]|nr:MAG: hypothetical protein E6I38_12020 [Chloroflexota bacterium]
MPLSAIRIRLIGNARAVAAVQRALASASPPHAWLFVGPEGVGKAGLARWLAQAVNCERNVEAGRGAGPEQPDISSASGETNQNQVLAAGAMSRRAGNAGSATGLRGEYMRTYRR